MSAAATARAASSPVATGRPGARSSVTSASGRVASRDTSGVRVTPAAGGVHRVKAQRDAVARYQEHVGGQRARPPRPTVPVSRAAPGASPSCGGPSRTGQGPVSAPGAGGMVANPTASAAVSRPDASPPSSSASPVPSSAVVAITALVRYGTQATALPVSSATTAASR